METSYAAVSPFATQDPFIHMASGAAFRILSLVDGGVSATVRYAHATQIARALENGERAFMSCRKSSLRERSDLLMVPTEVLAFRKEQG